MSMEQRLLAPLRTGPSLPLVTDFGHPLPLPCHGANIAAASNHRERVTTTNYQLAVGHWAANNAFDLEVLGESIFETTGRPGCGLIIRIQHNEHIVKTA